MTQRDIFCQTNIQYVMHRIWGFRVNSYEPLCNADCDHISIVLIAWEATKHKFCHERLVDVCWIVE